MIKAVISDFSRVILFPKDENYHGELNELHKNLSTNSSYNVLDNFYLNTDLLKLYKNLRLSIMFYIFTTGIVQNAPEIRRILDTIFTKIFTVSEVGYRKSDPKAYEAISRTLGLKLEEVIFIDDTKENIEAAKNAGLNTVFYTSNDHVTKTLKELLNS